MPPAEKGRIVERWMKARDYRAYIKSPAWQAKRKAYRSRYPWKCFVCGTTGKLHLHHTTYARLGEEQLEDLVPLCERHHVATHHLVQDGVSLVAAHLRISEEGGSGDLAWPKRNLPLKKRVPKGKLKPLQPSPATVAQMAAARLAKKQLKRRKNAQERVFVEKRKSRAAESEGDWRRPDISSPFRYLIPSANQRNGKQGR